MTGADHLDPRAEVAIDAINAAFGRHDGYRAVHAKGVIVDGTFTATPAAASLTTAAPFQGLPVPVVARFSNASGDPGSPDRRRDGRGLAVKFLLADGTRSDIVAVTLPSFLARTPEDFIAFTKVGAKPGLPLLLYLLRHREAWPAVRAAATLPVHPSYAAYTYRALHAFWWIAPDGVRRAVRYTWVPEPLALPLSKPDGDDHLEAEMATRLSQGPVRFTLQVQIAHAGDRIDDPTAPWPDDRERVEVGRLELTSLNTSRDRDGDVLVFDPTRVTPGIELSDDAILRFRSDAYAVSVLRRSGQARQP